MSGLFDIQRDDVEVACGFLRGHADEATIGDAIEQGLRIVDEEKRPFLLNVHLPLGLPEGGRPGAIYSMKDDVA